MFTTKITVSAQAPVGAHIVLKLLLASGQYSRTRKLDEHTVFVELPISMYRCRHCGTHIDSGDVWVQQKYHAEICVNAVDFLNNNHDECYSFSSIEPCVKLALNDADVHFLAIQDLYELEHQQVELIRAAEFNLQEAMRTLDHYKETIAKHEHIIKEARAHTSNISDTEEH